VRAKIVLKDIEHEKIDNNTYYVQIKNFGEDVDSEFKLALEAILEEKNIKKIIFDLRNNPGGYLGEVSSMLSYFVEKGLPTAIVDYGNRQVNYTSR
jgi:carboxyl-terminal processing protease